MLCGFDGPKWLPKESTILQVLISIQAMIFCDDPIHNEPGIQAMEQDAYGLEYVNALYPLTAKYALLDWAMNPPPLWRDEVAYHFKKNGDKILQTVEQWARVSRNSVINGSPIGELLYGSYSRQGAVGDLAVELPKLQKALERYGATYAPQKFEPTTAQRNPYSREHGAGRGASYGRGNMYGGLGGGMGYGGGAFGSQIGGGY
jgi:hypothetical protein